MFHIGQKVVCVNDDPYFYGKHHSGAKAYFGLTKGHIYTIRWIGRSYSNNPAVKLEEIMRYPEPENLAHDIPFGAKRFAPLEKKQTSIAVFQEMLVKTPEMADV